MADLSVEAPPMSRKQIRDFAHRIREALGVKDRVFIDVGDLLEFVLPAALPGFVYDIRGKKEMGNDHGLARPDQNMIILREDVYERAIDGKGRDRGTVIHELGHVLLHKSDRMIHRRSEGPPVAYRDPEWQAMAFAGEFLVPAHLMARFASLKDIVLACGVSKDCAAVQLRAYSKGGLIKKGQIRDLAF